MVDMEMTMTFNEAVAHLTRNGCTLLEVLEAIADAIHEAGDEYHPAIPDKDLAAYRLVVAKMRPLFV